MSRDIRFLTAFIILSAAILPLPALELALNGRTHSVLKSSVLSAHSRERDEIGGLPALSLSVLFPWMESVDGLEAISGNGGISWDKNAIDAFGWENVLLVAADGDWELRAGDEFLASPEFISLFGAPLPYREVRIWRAVDCPELSEDLESVLGLRGVDVVWRDVSHPDALFSDPPVDGPPDLVFLSDLDFISMIDDFGPNRVIDGSSAEWLGSSDLSESGEFFPAAADVRHPETALAALAAGNPDLQGLDRGFGDPLRDVLEEASALIDSGLLIDDAPLPALETGAAHAGFFPAGAGESALESDKTLIRIGAPGGFAEIARKMYAAIPAGRPDMKLSELVLKDAVRIGSDTGGFSLPSDERVVRFHLAYERISRLFFSRQLSAAEAAELISRYSLGR